MSFRNDFNLFIGGSIGSFKGLRIADDGIITKNLQNLKHLTKDQDVTAMSWGDNGETDILIATANQMVKVYDSEFKAYSNSVETKLGKGPIVGVTRINGSITTCVQSGEIKVWKYKQPEQVQLNTNGQVDCMRTANVSNAILATGGKENDLKLWNIETKKLIFNAKNVKKDFLDLEIPVWVSDIVFMPNNDNKIALTTRHGHVRLYDTQAQRRPVMDINIPKQSLNTLSLTCLENQVVVGSGTGHMLRVDLRMYSKVLNTYKGAVGSIREVVCSPHLPLVASVGLDRHLRVHHLESRKLLHQVYLKVKLNCLLMRSNFGQLEHTFPSKTQKQDLEEEEIRNTSDEEFDIIFDNMETVETKKRSIEVQDGIGNKKIKPG